MKAARRLDPLEGTVRLALGTALLLIAWDYGLTVIGTGAVVLGVIALATSIFGVSLLGRMGSQPPTASPHHTDFGHDVHDRAHEGHPIDTESL